MPWLAWWMVIIFLGDAAHRRQQRFTISLLLGALGQFTPPPPPPRDPALSHTFSAPADWLLINNLSCLMHKMRCSSAWRWRITHGEDCQLKLMNPFVCLMLGLTISHDAFCILCKARWITSLLKFEKHINSPLVTFSFFLNWFYLV